MPLFCGDYNDLYFFLLINSIALEKRETPFIWYIYHSINVSFLYIIIRKSILAIKLFSRTYYSLRVILSMTVNLCV